MENGNAENGLADNCQDEDSCSEQDDIWDDTALIKAYDTAVNAAKDKIAHRLGFEENESGPKSGSKKNIKKNSEKCVNWEWHVGDECRATYSDDGKIYEATIKSIKLDTNSCVVSYVGYGNEEEVPIPQLLVSEGLSARAIQEEEAACDTSEIDVDTNNLQANNEVNHLKHPMDGEKNDKDQESPPHSQEHLTNFGSQFPPPSSLFVCQPFPSSHMDSSYALPCLPPPPPLAVTSALPVGDSEALSAMLMSWYMSGFHTGYYQGLQQAKRLRSASKHSP